MDVVYIYRKKCTYRRNKQNTRTEFLYKTIQIQIDTTRLHVFFQTCSNNIFFYKQSCVIKDMASAVVTLWYINCVIVNHVCIQLRYHYVMFSLSTLADSKRNVPRVSSALALLPRRDCRHGAPTLRGRVNIILANVFSCLFTIFSVNVHHWKCADTRIYINQSWSKFHPVLCNFRAILARQLFVSSLG